MANPSYQATLDYLYTQLPMFQRIGPAAFKKDLSNTLALCAALGDPQDSFPSLHVAGTNGKGSTTHMLGAMLQAQGLKVGLYTSPHYRDFRERIKVNGRYISRRHVIDFVERYRSLFEEIRPSFFEITVVMAFDYFRSKKVDIAVIEVGLGGRLDSTNVITPLLSVITNISYDHQQFLGDTLELIAGEKAGIIKEGVPVVIGETQPETYPVFDRKAASLAVPIVYADRHYRAEARAQSLTHTVFDIYCDGKLLYPSLSVNATGAYQPKNVQTALQSVQWLNERVGFRPAVGEAAIRGGLDQLRALTRFMGRWQIIAENPTVLVDSAHNEGGLAYVTRQLQELKYRCLHIVLGAVNDKDIGKMLAMLPADARYYFARPDIPRGLPARDLQQQAAAYGLKGRTYSSVRNALRAARRHARQEDLIYVGGSTFVVAEVI